MDYSAAIFYPGMDRITQVYIAWYYPTSSLLLNAEDPDVVSENEADPGIEEETEGGSEDPESGDPDPVIEETISDNEIESQEGTDSVSENSASGSDSVSKNGSELVEAGSTVNYITYESKSDEYWPQAMELLTVMAGLLLFMALCDLLKYIYKFFRIFF